jgi:hypothetical protein
MDAIPEIVAIHRIIAQAFRPNFWLFSALADADTQARAVRKKPKRRAKSASQPARLWRNVHGSAHLGFW